MRNAFIQCIEKMAEQDSSIVLIVADIGFKIFDSFREKFPGRFFNVGIAEANAISFAAGLAAQGFKPFVYGIASFMTSRCLDQIRCDLSYHNSNVAIVGQGAGLSFGFDGFTHFAVDDIAMLYPLPNMKILCPGDPIETEAICKWIASTKDTGPIYLRLGKMDQIVHKDVVSFQLGKEIIVTESYNDTVILAMGNTLPIAVKVGEILKTAGNIPKIISMISMKPLDTEMIEYITTVYNRIVTIEEHSIYGGLGSIVAQYTNNKQKLYKFALPDKVLSGVGDHEYLQSLYGLSPEYIVSIIERK